MKKTLNFLVGLIMTCPLLSFAEPPINTVPSELTVPEDTEFNIAGVEVTDADDNLATVKLTVKQGKLKVTTLGSASISAGENNTKTLTLAGTQDDINATLASLSYQGNRNYRGLDMLTVISTDNSSPPESSGPTFLSLMVNRADTDGSCTSYERAENEGSHIGDLFKRLSLGSVVNYSVVRYNLADKKSSFNSQAFGFGAAFRYYSAGQLEQANTNDIGTVPLACRARTTDLLNFNQAPTGELPKIGAAFSFSPTFYVFKDKNENDLGTQLALNLGFLNDFLTVGVGWNLSGGDAGEWFVLAGPSVGFSF